MGYQIDHSASAAVWEVAERQHGVVTRAHAAAGLTTLRFTHAQITQDAHHVQATLAAVAGRLGGFSPGRTRV
jgi:hypothetical protein